MNRNTQNVNINDSDGKLSEISEIVSNLDCVENVESFIKELFTPSEIEDIVQRWNILKMLNKNESQRSISKTLSVSLCKVTRGAKILKDKKSIIRQILFDERWRK